MVGPEVDFLIVVAGERGWYDRRGEGKPRCGGNGIDGKLLR